MNGRHNYMCRVACSGLAHTYVCSSKKQAEQRAGLARMACQANEMLVGNRNPPKHFGAVGILVVYDAEEVTV